MILIKNEKFLRRPSHLVAPEEKDALVALLKEGIASYPGVGLSAVQVGVLKRAFIILSNDSNKEYQKYYTFVNPTIIGNSEEVGVDGEQVEAIEGCLSFPGEWRLVKRWSMIRGTDDVNGEFILMGLEARTFQHEFDHLDGVLFFDKGRKVPHGYVEMSYEESNKKIEQNV